MLATRNVELKKHVAIIHCNNKLTLLQRKIVNALLFHAYDHLLSREFHTIHIRELCNLVGYHSNDIKTVKAALVKLLSTVIEWNLLDKTLPDGPTVWNASAIISDASIEGSQCTYSYSRKMRELLHHPDMYGKISLEVQAKFKSGYSLALYENCIRYQNLRQTPWFDLSLFRLLMGVEEGTLTEFRDFKKRVINKALEEVNHYSPINVDVEYQKVGRQVDSIRFLITKKVPLANAELKINALDVDNELSELFSLSSVQIQSIHALYEPAYIAQKIEIVKASKNFKEGHIKNIAGYFLKALADDFKPIKGKKLKNSKQFPELKFYTRDNQNLTVTETNQYNNEWEMFQKLDQNAQKKFLKLFKEKIKGSPFEMIFEREGLENFVLRVDFLILFKKLHVQENQLTLNVQ